MAPKLISLLALAAIVSLSSETKIQMKDLPEPVQKTVKELMKTAKLRGLNKEVENGKTSYEAETTVNGKSRDVEMDVSGAIVEVEEATELGSIPPAARKALESRAGKILKVESVTKDSVVSYEAVIEKNGKKSEVAVSASGVVR